MRGLILIFYIALFSEIKQVLLMPVLYKFGQEGNRALKGVQESQTVLLIQFPREFGMLLVNNN